MSFKCLNCDRSTPKIWDLPRIPVYIEIGKPAELIPACPFCLEAIGWIEEPETDVRDDIEVDADTMRRRLESCFMCDILADNDAESYPLFI